MVTMLNEVRIWNSTDVFSAAWLAIMILVIPLLVLPWFCRKKVVLFIQCVLFIISLVCFVLIAFKPSLASEYGVPVVFAWLLRLFGLDLGLASLVLPVVYAYRWKNEKLPRWLYVIIVAYLITVFVAIYLVLDEASSHPVTQNNL